MDRELLCRLCMSTNNSNDHLNMFSVAGMEMKMCEIISEHFKCEVSELDALPNCVCQLCWRTTEAFHDLYQKSKEVQEKFLISPPIKVEPDTNELWQSNEETQFVEELQLNSSPTKIETYEDESILNDNDLMDYDDNFANESDEVDEKNNDSEPYKENSDEEAASARKTKQTRKCDLSAGTKIVKSDKKNATSVEKDAVKKNASGKKDSALVGKRGRPTSPEYQERFDEIFAEHKHRFDLSCDSCSTIFETLNEARMHYARKHKNKHGYIKCCDIKFSVRSSLLTHLKRHRDPSQQSKPLRNKFCSVCSRTFCSKPALTKHMKTHENDKSKEIIKRVIQENFDMKCTYADCNTVFITFNEAKYHYQESHNADAIIKCKTCNFESKRNRVFMDHCQYHLDPGHFKCDICSRTFADGRSLVTHKYKIHTSKIPFICDFCGKTILRKKALKFHIFSQHVDMEKKFECEVCNKKFKFLKMLKAHLNTHVEKKRTFTCEICGKSFVKKAQLHDHIATNHKDSSERIAKIAKQCPICHEWLLSKSSIYYHKKLHEDLPVICEHCQKELPNRRSYLHHIKKYHTVHKFKCSFCEKTYPVASKLKVHEESHTRHRSYPCKHCPSDNPKVFAVYDSLRTHMGRYHREERDRLNELKKLQRIPPAIKE